MANTFIAAQSATNPLFRARRQLNDVGQDVDDAGLPLWYYSDEEIQSYLTADGFNEGVAILAESLAIKFANEPDTYNDDGGLKVSWKHRVDAWFEVARRLRSSRPTQPSSTTSQGRFVGGTLLKPDISGLR